jgi:hypothetical protein
MPIFMGAHCEHRLWHFSAALAKVWAFGLVAGGIPRISPQSAIGPKADGLILCVLKVSSRC